MLINKSIKFSIIGAGRFGMFWAKHLDKYFPVSMYDIDTRREKVVKEVAQWADVTTCLKKDFIFLTIPIRKIVPFIREHKNKFQTGTTIIDCASIKEPVMKWILDDLPEGVFYIASHPLFGPDSAREGLDDHVITVIPGRVPYQNYKFLVHFFEQKLNLRVENMPASEHDRLMAYNLSLIHHLGRTFNKMKISRVPLMMDSLSKLNSISKVVMNDSEELFTDFYTFNRFSKEVTDKFKEQFDLVVKEQNITKK
jgi:prephenate dehydrogenase